MDNRKITASQIDQNAADNSQQAFIVDHDYHIHSQLSSCSKDPEQTTAFILRNAKEKGYKRICLTDHFWDERVEGSSRWYAPQNYEHVCRSLPLPQEDGIEFLFGVETEMTKDNTIAISPERFDSFAFVIIPVSHFHMVGFSLSEEDAASDERRAEKFIEKLEALLAMPLPFHKIGLAHLANDTLGRRELDTYCKILQIINGSERLPAIFARAAEVGAGIELNTSCLDFRSSAEQDAVIKFYTMAKNAGCKFYFGSDSHHPGGFKKSKEVAENTVKLLGLTEADKFKLVV